METYYIKSLIGEVAEGIKRLISQKVIQRERKVILYGLDRYSFAMRTILSNLGYNNIEGYVSDHKALVLQYQTEIENFSCRFLNQRTDVIKVWSLEEMPMDPNAVILLASKSCQEEKQKLEAFGYRESIHYYVVCDFEEKEWKAFFEKRPRMTLPEIKTVEKGILTYVDEFCRKQGFRYWVCGGTLLGTLRHQGFIPWDDDIDIFLPWKDYQRLIKAFEETEQFCMLGFGTSERNDYPDLWAKAADKRTIIDEDIGTVRKRNPLWIDIFPLIGLPEEEEERLLFFDRYKELNRQIWQDFYAENGSIDVFSKWYGKQKGFLSQYDFDQSSYVGVLGTKYGERDHTARRVYEETLRMSFEDIEVNVPAGYQEYLDNLYGSDWMELPEESKRKTHHRISAYWNIPEGGET